MKNLFVLLGLFIGVGAISLSCRNNYKEKYIHLLEEHINTLNIEEIEDAEAPDLEPMIIEEVQGEAKDYFLFLCGDDSNLLDMRVRRAGQGKWNIIYRIKTLEIDEFGFNIEKTIALTGYEWNGQLRFDDSTLKLMLCD